MDKIYHFETGFKISRVENIEVNCGRHKFLLENDSLLIGKGTNRMDVARTIAGDEDFFAAITGLDNPTYKVMVESNNTIGIGYSGQELLVNGGRLLVCLYPKEGSLIREIPNELIPCYVTVLPFMDAAILA